MVGTRKSTLHNSSGDVMGAASAAESGYRNARIGGHNHLEEPAQRRVGRHFAALGKCAVKHYSCLHFLLFSCLVTVSDTMACCLSRDRHRRLPVHASKHTVVVQLSKEIMSIVLAITCVRCVVYVLHWAVMEPTRVPVAPVDRIEEFRLTSSSS